MKSTNFTPCFPVLVIGFGKIGTIKSEIWKSLGAEVYVYDISPSANGRVSKAGYTPFNLNNVASFSELIVDISTPAAKHASALEWVLDTLPVNPRCILFEKPLVSSRAELIHLQNTLHSHPEVDKQHIFINESYYASAALKKVRDLINDSGETIKEVSINLSKNRISDNDNGRFFDYELGAIGIEMPHMIAIAQYFGLDLSVLAEQSAKLYVDSSREDNQGVAVRYKDCGVSVDLTSFLGDFKIDDYDEVAENQNVTRMLAIKTNTKLYEVLFDPAPDVPRYHARVTDTNLATGKQQDYLLADDHLRMHLTQFTSPQHNEGMEYISLQNSIAICELLFTLRANALIHEIIPSSQTTSKQHVLV